MIKGVPYSATAVRLDLMLPLARQSAGMRKTSGKQAKMRDNCISNGWPATSLASQSRSLPWGFAMRSTALVLPIPSKQPIVCKFALARVSPCGSDFVSCTVLHSFVFSTKDATLAQHYQVLALTKISKLLSSVPPTLADQPTPWHAAHAAPPDETAWVPHHAILLRTHSFH